jgi:pectate lyase
VARRAVQVLALLALIWSHARSSESFEGFGAATRGAEDCADHRTYRVTSLGDSGAGTLRDGLSQGCRLIVFDVAGTIQLQSTLNIPHSYVTVDGATAPAPGITILQPLGVATTIEAMPDIGPVHDVILRHLRMIGQRIEQEGIDIWGLDGEAHPVYNIILDHLTAVAAQDGVFDIWGRVYNVSISWNLIMDTSAALHLSRAEDIRENISFHHNVFARNRERQIRIKYDSRADYVNNVVYGWGWGGCGAAGLNIDTSHTVDPTINVVGNVFHYVSDTGCGGPDDAIVYSGNGTDAATVFMRDNIVPAQERDAAGTVETPMPIPAYAQVTIYPPSSLGDTVAPCAGVAHKTPSEQALLEQVSRAIGGRGETCGTANIPLPPQAPQSSLSGR